MSQTDKAIITCAVTGVLTNPKQHPVPVTVEQMARSSKEAFDAGATILHLHFRMQDPGFGHMPTWDPDVAGEITSAVREACPGVVINMSTGVIGTDISGPADCMRRIKPEMAACNAGSLNYLRTRKDGSWAWPPMVFDNPVEKVQSMLDVMNETGAVDEDIGAAEIFAHRLRQRVYRLRRSHIQRQCLCRLKTRQLAGIQIGHNHRRAFGNKHLGNRATDALSGSGDNSDFILQTSSHVM